MSKASIIEDSIADYIQLVMRGYFKKIQTTGIPVRRKINGKWTLVAIRKNPKQVGAMDCLVMFKGIAIRVEVKTKGDVESLEQRIDREQWEAAGGESMIVKSLDDFIEQFKAISKALLNPIEIKER